MAFSKENRSFTLNGLLFVFMFALSSLYISELPWVAELKINSLVIAIVLGIAYSNTLRHCMPAEWAAGIHFAAKQLLRTAIVLYGFRVTFQQIMSVGLVGLTLDIIVVGSTLALGIFAGMKLFKLDRDIAILISAGAAICGAAAVLAVEDVLKSESYKTAVAVGTVVLFGTIAMFLYPFLQHVGVFGFTESQYGIYAGASVHEVAQALVAGEDVSSEAGNIAVIVKMTRVLLLVPVIFILAFWLSRRSSNNQQKATMVIPWFALGFIAIIGFNSLQLLPGTVVSSINKVDGFLLTMAMAAIGMETNINKIKNVGLKPLYLATILFAWLMTSAYLLVRFI